MLYPCVNKAMVANQYLKLHIQVVCKLLQHLKLATVSSTLLPTRHHNTPPHDLAGGCWYHLPVLHHHVYSLQLQWTRLKDNLQEKCKSIFTYTWLAPDSHIKTVTTIEWFCSCWTLYQSCLTSWTAHIVKMYWSSTHSKLWCSSGNYSYKIEECGWPLKHTIVKLVHSDHLWDAKKWSQ